MTARLIKGAATTIYNVMYIGRRLYKPESNIDHCHTIDTIDYVTGIGNLSRDPNYARTICAYVDSFGWLLDKDGGEGRLETVYLQFHCLLRAKVTLICSVLNLCIVYSVVKLTVKFYWRS